MRKLRELLGAKRLVIILILFLLCITIPNLNKPAMSQTEAIVTMLCLDKVDGKITTTATVLTPGQDKQANHQVFSGVGETLGEAVGNIALSLGKEMSFAQCEIMALGDNLCDEGIIQSLDYMTRTKKVGRNAILINFSGDIDDFSNAVVSLSKEKNLKLSDIINYDKRYILAEESNIELFYIGFFSNVPLGIMPQIKIGDTKSDNAIEVSSTGSSSNGSTDSASQSEQKKYLVNDGTTNVFRNGKRELILEPEFVKKLNLFLDIEQRGEVRVENVTDDLYNDATVVVELIDKKLSKKASFKNGKPKYSIDTELTVTVEEVLDTNPERDMLRRNQEFLTDALIEKIKEKVHADMTEVITFCKDKDLDLIALYKSFYRFHYKEWQHYLEEVGHTEYLDDVDFDISIQVHSPY